MGIRVNKVLGWGLTDVSSEDDEINDSRINSDDLFIAKKYSLEGFKKYWESNYTEEMDYLMFKNFFYKDTENISISHCISYDPEGLSNILVITPVSMMNNWQRYDDIIDYQEETYFYNQEDRYHIFDFGIFPWNGSFCDSKGDRWTNTKKVPHYSIVSEFIKMKNNKELDEHQKNAGLTYFSELLGYNTVDEAEKDIIPIIPEEVQIMCNYLELFKDTQTIYQLRPMLYVFWR